LGNSGGNAEGQYSGGLGVPEKKALGKSRKERLSENGAGEKTGE